MGTVKFTFGILTGFVLVEIITVDFEKPLQLAARFGGTGYA
jgi:hypothetical protein